MRSESGTAYDRSDTVNNKSFYEHNLSAQQLQAQEVKEESRSLSVPYGTMVMKEWYFDGIRLKYSDNRYTGYYSFEKKNEMDVVSLGFNLKGRAIISQCGKTFIIGPQQHNIIYTNGFPNTFRNVELHSETFFIEFTPDAFLKTVQDGNEILKRFADSMQNGQPLVLSPENLFINPALHGAIHDILHCRFTGGLKRLFLLSKSIEILVMQAEAFNTAEHFKSSCFKRNDDRDKIMYAREYLVQKMEDPPSLSELALVAGINEYKLKRGFKEMFNTTTFGYLSEYRLDMAKRKLLDNGKTISEIAYELGYSSPQHFSNAFRKKFGISPRQARM